MATITIENVPESEIIKYWDKINYSDIKISILSKKDKNRLEWLWAKEIEEKFYNKEDDSYGPFVWEENKTFLKSLM